MKKETDLQKANHFIASLQSDIAMRDKSLEECHLANEEIKRRNDIIVGRNRLLEARGYRLITKLLSAHMAIARLCGFIERVHEKDDERPEIGEMAKSGVGIDSRKRIEELLNMGDLQFGRAVEAMGEDELADILGKPDEPTPEF
jgi:hypothetical protein